MADQLDVVRTGPGLQELPDPRLGLQLVHALARKAHELPAAEGAAVAHPRRHESRGPRGIAVLPGLRETQPLHRHPLFQEHVDHQPVRLEAAVLLAAADRPAHQGVRAVAADHVAGGERLLLARPAVAQAHVGQAGVLGDRGRRPAQVQRDPGLRPHGLVEGRLQGRLVDEVDLRSPRDRRGAPVDDQELLPGGVEPLVERAGVGYARENVAHAVGRQHAVEFVVDAHRPRERVAGRPALTDRHGAALAPQHQG